MHNYKYAILLGGGINTMTKLLSACWVADRFDLQVTTCPRNACTTFINQVSYKALASNHSA
jgi:hypothetical protein